MEHRQPRLLDVSLGRTKLATFWRNVEHLHFKNNLWGTTVANPQNPGTNLGAERQRQSY